MRQSQRTDTVMGARMVALMTAARMVARMTVAHMTMAPTVPQVECLVQEQVALLHTRRTRVLPFISKACEKLA